MGRIIYSDLRDNIMSKTKKAKVFIVGSASSYANWLPNIEIVRDEKEADVLLFTGGEDITPSIYGHHRHPQTSCNPERDKREITLAKWAVENNKKILGICRGAQLACVVAGGSLIQHQENKDFIHPINIVDGRPVLITSTHHQAMYPYSLKGKEYLILGWTENHCRYHYNGKNEEVSPSREVEICYFPAINALGIQGHPEMLWRDREDYVPTFDFLHRLFHLFINNSLEKNYR